MVHKRKIIELENGLKLVYKRVTSKEAVYVSFKFDGGLYNDPIDKLGLTHFTEHCVGLSGGGYTRQQKNDYCNSLFYSSFITGVYYTQYVAYIADTQLEDVFDHYTKYLSDVNPTKEEFENERKVILQECVARYSESPGKKLYNLRLRNCKTYVRGIDPTIGPGGTPETIKNITLDDVKNCAKETFCQNNCTIFIYGNVSLRKVKNLINKYVYTRLNKHTDIKFLSHREGSDFNVKKGVYFEKSLTKENSIILACISLKNKEIDKLINYKSYILNLIIKNTAHEYFRNKLGLSYSQASTLSSTINYNLNYSLCELYVRIDTKPEDTQKILEALPEFFKYLGSVQITQEKIDTTREYINNYDKCYQGVIFRKRAEYFVDDYLCKLPIISNRETKRRKKTKDKMPLADFIELYKQTLQSVIQVYVIAPPECEELVNNKLITKIKNNLKWTNKL